jgi:uncharacterized protein YdeI (YjbR/CyaY-like superfamily)
MWAAKRLEAPVRLFKDQSKWEVWLKKNHKQHSGVWLRITKKDSGVKSVSHAEALESALCYGWIDGQKRPENDKTWLQKFVPRSPKSLWSRINRDKAEALIKNGRMMPAGVAAIEEAKASGRWQAAYDSFSRATVPADLEAALASSPRAKAFFCELDGANRYAILFRIQTVKKPETRARKIREFVEMLSQHETIHPRGARRSAK